MGFFDQINTAENFNEAAAKEKHLPLVTIEDLGNRHFSIHVDVISNGHPNEMDHWIQFVELRIDDMYVGRAEFSAVITEPKACFHVVCPTKAEVSVLARCNKHGLWLTKKTIA